MKKIQILHSKFSSTELIDFLNFLNKENSYVFDLNKNDSRSLDGIVNFITDNKEVIIGFISTSFAYWKLYNEYKSLKIDKEKIELEREKLKLEERKTEIEERKFNFQIQELNSEISSIEILKNKMIQPTSLKMYFNDNSALIIPIQFNSREELLKYIYENGIDLDSIIKLEFT